MIVQNCPKHFLEAENFAYLAAELCFAFLFKFLRSASATSPSHSSCEDLISVSLTAAKALLWRSELKKQLHLLLAYVLVGYKCSEGASTDSSFSKASEYVQSISQSLKNHVDDKSKLGEDDIFLLRTIIRASTDLFAISTMDCIKNLHLEESKKSNLCKLLQTKLAFSLEQMASFAKLAYEIESVGDDQENKPMLFAVLSNCIRCIQATLTDQDMQVNSIGLQVLRSILLRGSHAENSCFLIFFTSEIIEDVITIVQQKLVKPIKMEAVLATGECLKILMLLQTLSKTTECQKGLMHLLLEVVVLVFLTTENDLSQEVKELRNIAVRLVSQLAQIPKSASCFKDVLLTMPAERREKLQGMIRASVIQDQKTAQIKSPTQSFLIKLPPQAEESKEKIVPPSSYTEHRENSSEEDEDDDWDAFQSFPASRNEVDPSTKVQETTKSPISDVGSEDNKSSSNTIEISDGQMSSDNQHEVVAREIPTLEEEYDEPDGACSSVEHLQEGDNNVHMEKDEVGEGKDTIADDEEN